MARVRLAAGLLLLLTVICSSALIVAAPDVLKWSRVDIPTEGKAGKWVLANGSDVQHLTRAIDGTLYCFANPAGTSSTLFKSTDGGYSWAYTGEIAGNRVTDNIVAIATSPDDANLVYFATVANVYESTDAGSNFHRLPPNPGGAGSNNIEITSLAVSRLEGNNLIAVSTKDKDGTQYGGVYILDEKALLPGWVDTNIGSYDVYTVSFSPVFPADRLMAAVVSNELDTFVTTKIGDDGWGTTTANAKINGLVPVSACIAFPGDYDATFGDYILFVGINAGGDNGDAYMVGASAIPNSSTATDLNIGANYKLNNVDVSSLAVSGKAAKATLLAGTANSAQVYISTDGGTTWKRSTKEPTGQSRTYVLMASGSGSGGKAYAATSGNESAFSMTSDLGITWNQLGLIDTRIGTGNILDLAVSPRYSQDNTLFMLTFGAKHSLWRSLNGGLRWERVFTSTLANVDSLKLVKLSPQFGDKSQVVYLAGASNGRPAVWKSTDNGQEFIRRSAPLTVRAWAIVNDTTLFLGSYDDTNGLVYRTTNSGFFYATGVVVGNQSLKSIVLSPNYQRDGTMLVGNTAGWVYRSSDNGDSFEPLPPDATSAPLKGNISVAFDPEFASNNTVYAASDGSDNGTYRFIIGKSTKWESIDSTLPGGGMLSQLVVSADGALYASNLKANGGLERCLDPTYSLGPTFETVTKGLDNGAKLGEVWLQGNQLWATDVANTKLMTYIDSATGPPALKTPPDKAAGIGTIVNNAIKDVSIDWETLDGATKYKWQLNYHNNFTTVPAGFEDQTAATSARLPSLESATTYYWRVRATEPVLSPWSDKWSFITSLGTATVVPQLYSPEAGASDLPLKPIFQWSPMAGADRYELLLSREASFANPLITKISSYALPGTAWQCDIGLDYNTTYYWKVRGCSSDTDSAWSAVGAFTTRSAPVPSLYPEQAKTPAPSLSPLPQPQAPQNPPSLPSTLQPIVPDWVKYLIGAQLVIIVLLLFVMLALVLTVRRF